MEQEMKSKKLQVTILLEKNEALALPTSVTIEDISYYPNIGEVFNFTFILGEKELNDIYTSLSDFGREKLEIFHKNRGANDEISDIHNSLLGWGSYINSSFKVTKKVFEPGDETENLFYSVAYLDKI